MPSQILQQAITFIILRCIFETKGDWDSEVLLDICVQILYITHSSQAASYCFYTFLKYVKRMSSRDGKRGE